MAEQFALRAPVDDPHQTLRTFAPDALGITPRDPSADDAAPAPLDDVTVDAATVMRRT